MRRTILHIDMNNCFASIECLHRPLLWDRPVVVGGDAELRHGIVLAKNERAKAYGIRTAETLWQARQKCPDLVVVPPDYSLYLRFSQMARAIYEEYTDRVEPFGLDESWLDVTGCAGCDGAALAERLRRRVKRELGITVSVGVADNKAFAKLGSDMKKPDAVTVLPPERYAALVWPQPVSNLLYVGPATTRRLAQHGVFTIGELAGSDPRAVRGWLGRPGEMLWRYANGQDTSPVTPAAQESAIKSIGNSTTTPRDIRDEREAKAVFYVLAESVAARLRAHGFRAQEVSVSLRDTNLSCCSHQQTLERPTDLAEELCRAAMELLRRHYDWRCPLRSVGIHAGRLHQGQIPLQTTLFLDERSRIRQEKLERTVDSLRGRFGKTCIRRAITMRDATLGTMTPPAGHSAFGAAGR